MATINIYENLSDDLESILIEDEYFLQNCKESYNNGESDIITITDKFGNNIKLWDHQRDEFIGE